MYGTHPEILETVLRLINKNDDWQGDGHTAEERVIELFMRNTYDLLLLGGGIPAVSEHKIRALFKHAHPDSLIIQHYGGGSGLLKSEIKGALDHLRKKRLQVNDNPFAFKEVGSAKAESGSAK